MNTKQKRKYQLINASYFDVYTSHNAAEISVNQGS